MDTPIDPRLDRYLAMAQRALRDAEGALHELGKAIDRLALRYQQVPEPQVILETVTRLHILKARLRDATRALEDDDA